MQFLKSNFINVIRWLLFLPGAVASAFTAYFIFKLFNYFLSWLNGYNPNSPLSRFWTESIASFMMGAAFVYFGVRIAPKHERLVAGFTAIIGVLAIGASMGIAVVKPMEDAASPFLSGIFATIGIAATTFSILNALHGKDERSARLHLPNFPGLS